MIWWPVWCNLNVIKQATYTRQQWKHCDNINTISIKRLQIQWQVLTRCLHSDVVIWIDTDVLLLHAKCIFAVVNSLQLMMVIEIRPTPQTAVNNVRQSLLLRHLQTTVQWPRHNTLSSLPMLTQHQNAGMLCVCTRRWNMNQKKGDNDVQLSETTSSSAIADKHVRHAASRQTAKILIQSCDHNHTPFVGDMSSCC